MTDTTIPEALFYAAQAAFSYRGGDIFTWEQAGAGEQAGYVALAAAIGEQEGIDDEELAQAIITPLGDLIPGGLNRAWDDMSGRARFGLLLVVQAYRKALL